MAGTLRMLVMRSWPRTLCSCKKTEASKCEPFVKYFTSTPDKQQPKGENAVTVQNLCRLSVDIRKIRRIKGWVLFKEETYVEEIAGILQKIGTNETAIAHILECCPEAILCYPTAVNAQIDLWQSVCRNKNEVVALIEQFPESFFVVKDQENQKLNVKFFQELGLKNVIISRFLTTAPNIFCNSIEKNKRTIKMLEESYLNLGGSQANMKVWLLKLLSQDPFILLNSSTPVKETLELLQKQGFTDLEVLQLLSKLKGFLFRLSHASLQESIFFAKSTFKCSHRELKELILKSPALLYYTAPILEERIQNLLKEGVSIAQIRETPMVLELTPQIVQYRIRKLNALGYSIRNGNLENLNGTKKEFESNFGKIQARKQRPLFNPVAPLNVED
ncbi:transcription termination factor 2, mitochondrial [Phascolarctos cinereus]|uniref:Transcription termination factor 2, mitochondrial n=1 Tax=Phascolarctos cinereus TaxID=38626 RepID=A0A6P5JZ86_PHACI|nr:transcription termination factor 2, mitochondrial [Phascolarctos cinereus]XP_020838100.1 transcription termination factor 2, mitochondrial [Phascolarctos cinereus]